MQFFYSNQIEQNRIFFDDSEIKHVKSSLRKKEGDLINVLDGKGYAYEATLHRLGKKWVAVINNKQFIDPPIYELLLAVAPTKNQGRFDTMVEKCTELGCSQFIPLISRHSERRNINLDRLKKITVSALKQSGRLYLPQVSTAHLFDELIEKIKDYEQKFIAHCHIGTLPFLGKLAERGGKVAVLIGPEGDFSQEEVEKSKAYGFEEVSLGSYRLRTETAGMFVCSILATVNQ